MQRRIKAWRALEGPAKEVFFPQEHRPGVLAQSDFTDLGKLGITLAGVAFPHLLYHFVLTYSNWETGMIRVCRKTVRGESWHPKTGRNRRVPISTVLRRYLREYEQPTQSVWFFPSPRGMRWDPDNFSQTLREINRANGLPWSCLDFRHTFGSQLAIKGESLYKISELLGNSPDICRKHYAALIPELMRDTVEFAPRPRLAALNETNEACA